MSQAPHWILVAALGVGAVGADPLDGRVRSFQVSFPRDWKGWDGPGGDRRRLAAHALARTGGGTRLARLAVAGDIETRRVALWALQFAYDESCEESLRKAAGDYRLYDVRLELALAAGPGSPAARDVWTSAFRVGRLAEWPPGAVARMDPELRQTRTTLRRGVASEDEATRCAALRLITEAGAEDSEVLAAALSLALHESDRTRYRAAEYVGICGSEDPRAFDALLHAVSQGAGEKATWALLRFTDRVTEIERALLRATFSGHEHRVRIAQLLYRLGAVSEEVVRVLAAAAGGWRRSDGVPAEPSLSMLRDSPECHEIVLRRGDRVLPMLGLGADRYGAQFATLVNRPRAVVAVLDALPAELLEREDVLAAVRRHAASGDAATALAARLALWRGDVDRADLVAWAREHPREREGLLRSVQPVRSDARHDLDRALVEMLLDPPQLDGLSRFSPFAAEIRAKVEPLLREPQRTFEAARCLAELGFRSPAIEAGLKSRLVDPWPPYAEAAMRACASAGVDLVAAYTALLPDRRACLWLGLAGEASASAAPRLAQLVAREDCGTTALWALGEIRAPLEPQAHDAIVALLVAAELPR